MRSKKYIVIAALVVVAAAVIYYLRSSGDTALAYQTAQVQRGDILAQVEATGTINAVTSVQVGSQVSGTISKLSADFNSQVKKGQLIAQIDPSLFEGNLLQARADLENASASLAAAKANWEKAKATAVQTRADYQRTVGLAKEGVLSAQQLDLAKSNADSADAQVSAAQAQIRQADAQVKQRAAAVAVAKTNLDHTSIYAPIDGTVVNRAVDVGQTVAASLQAPTLFTIAQDLTKMEVYAKTDESDVGRIRPGQDVMFKVDAFPNEVMHGKVQEVRMNPTVVQNVVTYDTIVLFDNPDRKMFPGMTAYVTIPVARADNVLKVPNGAIRFKPDLEPQKLAELCQKYGVAGGVCGGRKRNGSGGVQANATGGQGDNAAASNGGSSNMVTQANAAPTSQSAGSAVSSSGEGQAAGADKAQNSGRGGWRSRQGGDGASGNSGGNQGQANASASASADRTQRQTSIVWKLLPDKSLQPVEIATGITDFTFTEVRNGSLQEGDKIVTGSTGGRSASGAPRLGAAPGGNRPPGR